MGARTARRVSAFVHLVNRDTGETVVLEPGQEVPSWADELVTNAKALAADDAEAFAAAGATTPEQVAAVKATTAPAARRSRGKGPTAAEKKAAKDAAALAEAQAAEAAAAAASEQNDGETGDTGEPPAGEAETPAPPTFNPNP